MMDTQINMEAARPMGEPVKPEIAKSFGELEDEIIRTQDLLESLYGRIDPILGPDISEGQVTRSPEAVQLKSHLAIYIDEIAIRARTTNERLSWILERIEL